MKITARVQNHLIALPEELMVPDGTEVQVQIPDLAQPTEHKEWPNWLRNSIGVADGGLMTDEILDMTKSEA
jgi:hypothetical protein